MTPVIFNGSAADKPADTQYFLKSAICLYSQRTANVPELAMQHPANPDGTLGPGKPIDPIALAKTLYRLKQGEMVEKLSLHGEHVLAENRDAVLWWRPASVTPLWFKTATPVPELTALNGVPLPQPPLLFKASKGQNAGLRVWALLENRRPTAETELFHAPYMNCSQGHVCLGNARSRDLNDIKKAGPADWEIVFFNSNFSHTPPPLNYALSKKTKAPADEDAADTKLETYAAFLTSLRTAIEPGLQWSNHSRATFSRALLRAGKSTVASIL